MLFIVLPSLGFSQYYWDFGGSLGAANYLGEMGGKEDTRKDFVNDIKLSQTRFAGSGFARYKLLPNISLKAEMAYLRISGDDKLSTNRGRRGRNLSFFNNIFELSLTGQYYFYEINDLGKTYRYRNDFRAYGFAGIAAFHHNPKTVYNGEKVALQPLNTEGLSKPYSLWGMSIPMGIGFYFTIEKKYRIGWELGWRKTFTDYLDDVSGTYATDEQLGNDPLRIALANRRPELGDDPNVAEEGHYLPPSLATNGKRGDPTHKDNYMFTAVNFSYVIRGKSNFYRSKYGHLFKGKKSKKRRKRAKF